MGGVADTVKNAFSNPVRGLTAVGTFGTSELARKMGSLPSALARFPETATNKILGTSFGDTGTPGIGGSGPFSLDPAQLAANQAAIAAEGQKQYGQSQEFITSDMAAREAARGKLAQLLSKSRDQAFSTALPGIAEDANAGGVYTGTGFSDSLAREKANLEAQVQNQLAQSALGDVDVESRQRASALSGLQGYQQAGLGRGLSLEDFINSANVAKTIGAQTAPQVNNAKGQTGTLLSGVGATAPLVTAFRGK